MSGFREVVLVCGPPAVQPVIDHCILRCSGACTTTLPEEEKYLALTYVASLVSESPHAAEQLGSLGNPAAMLGALAVTLPSHSQSVGSTQTTVGRVCCDWLWCDQTSATSYSPSVANVAKCLRLPLQATTR
eukprot:227086-Prorocentrum_minimum.AAC.4